MNGASHMRIWEGLDEDARNWTTLWQECVDWSLPHKDNITRISIGGEEKPVQRMIDTCVEANFNFASGMYAYMFPTGTVWAKFRHPNPAIMAEPDVARYFEEVSRIIHETLATSNFAQELQESLLDLGAMGTNCVYLEEDDEDHVRFRSFTVGTVRLGCNSKGRIDTVGRKLSLSTRQMLQEFGEKALEEAGLGHIKDMLESKEKHNVIHLVRPNFDWDKSKLVSKRFESVYIHEKSKMIIKSGGYDYLPYFAGRFTVGNNETYGRGPMMMTLSTARRTNVIYRSMILSGEQAVNPQWLMPDDDSVSFKGNPGKAGTIIYWRATNPNARPTRLDPGGNPQLGMEFYQHHDGIIKRAFFNHLFRPLDEYRGMTAYEVNQRISADLMALAPFISRYQDEVISPMMRYVYYILQKHGVLPELPMQLLDSPRFEIEYVGKLSLATKSFELSGSLQVLQMFSEVGRYAPQALEGFDNVDMDKLFIEAWYNSSASMGALKGAEEVEEVRAERQRQLEMQQQMQAMPAMGDAYFKGTKAPEEGSPSAMLLEEG
jgi:hypothetical protein